MTIIASESPTCFVYGLGVMVNTRRYTAVSGEGSAGQLDVGFATNTLGTFALTGALAPALARCPGSRVVIVSSGGM